MFNEKYVREYIEIIKKDSATYGADYLDYVEKIANSSAIYRGEPVPGLYQGIFYDEVTAAVWEQIATTMISISNKVTRHYLENPAYRKQFGFPEEMEKLILHDPGYDMAIPMARYDIFYNDPENFWFCECNTDGSSAMNEDNTLGRLLLESKGMREFSKRYSLHNRDYFTPWVEKSLALYREIKGVSPTTIAIADFKESGTPYEFIEFQKHYEAKGIQTVLPDLRELRYENGALMFEDHVIDMVYRRVTTSELVEKADQAKAFIEAYYDNAFVCVGSMRSQVLHNKIAFAILHTEETKALLTQKEREFVEKHIPFTAELNQDSKAHVLANKDRYIIKPSDSRGSQGVYVGRDYSQEAYEALIDEVLKGQAIYQTYIDAANMDFAFFDKEGAFSVQQFVPLFGMFIYMEEFAGIYTRVGAEHIISGLTSYFVAPNIEVGPWQERES